ncbi:type II toxin-antitoxin system PemK/MazF family toxin [Paenibacillus sp. FSL P4-0502]|uniref:type II toxin-antitoxin system PemK/MazF family toxin n=1 Tax=Paenibacillus sp. FSL P4-0502 TaxID=2975319 RepID=UPI0030FA3210
MSTIETFSHDIVFTLTQKPIRRGQIWMADLGLAVGSIQSGERPFLVLQNDIGNVHSSCVWGVPLTSKISKNKLPTHVNISTLESGLKFDSIIQTEQPRTLHKWFLVDYLTTLDNEIMDKVNNAFLISAGMII